MTEFQYQGMHKKYKNAKHLQQNYLRKHLSKKIRFLAYTCIIGTAALVICLVMNGFHTQAANDTMPYKYKYYRSVILDQDHSLNELAAEYADPEYYRNTQVYLHEVADINHLTITDGVIQNCKPGTHLILPYYDKEYKE